METIFTRKVQDTIISSCPAVSGQAVTKLFETLWTLTAVGVSLPRGPRICFPETNTVDTVWLSVLLLELTYLKCAHLCFPPTPSFTTFKSWCVFHKRWETLHDAYFCPRLQGLFWKPFCMWWVEIWQLVIVDWSWSFMETACSDFGSFCKILLPGVMLFSWFGCSLAVVLDSYYWIDW